MKIKSLEVVARSRSGEMGKANVNKAIRIILPFIWIHCLKQQDSVRRFFCSFKFENNSISSKLFSCVFRSSEIIYTKLVSKTSFFYARNVVWVYYNYLQSFTKDFLCYSANCRFLKWVTDHNKRLNISPKHK